MGINEPLTIQEHPEYGVSVIICTYNGKERIISTLEALTHQRNTSGIPWEVLVVDNGSTDNTDKAVADYWQKANVNIPLRLCYEPLRGKSNALVHGFNSSKYELMVICDDDNWLQPEYLSVVADLYREIPNIGLLGGYGVAEFKQAKKPLWFDKWEKCYVCGQHHSYNGFLKAGDYSIWGAGSVLRKSLWKFLESNGFQFVNSTGAGRPMCEDNELALAVMFTGHKLYYDDRLWFYHDMSYGRTTWDNLMLMLKTNGVASSVLSLYFISYQKANGKGSSFVTAYYSKILLKMVYLVYYAVIKREKPWVLYYVYQIKELIVNVAKYKKEYRMIHEWVTRVANTYPLDDHS